MEDVRMVLMGFDGASWKVIHPLLQQGRLPNFAKLMRNGVYAKLRSPFPASTPILWTTILSGTKAGTHGIRNFFNTSQDLLVPRVWDIVMHGGKSAGVAGHYFTYPISHKLRFCIPSHFDPGVDTLPERYRFVRQLTRSFRRKAFSPMMILRNGIDALRNGLSIPSMSVALRSASSTLLDRSYLNCYHRLQRTFMAFSFDVFLHAYLTYHPDFATFYTPLPDTVSHRYWSFHEHECFDNVTPREIEKYGNVIINTYMHIDRVLGRLLASIPANTQVCVVSDHGSKRKERPRDSFLIIPEKLIDVLDMKNRIVVTSLGHQVFVQPKNRSDELRNEILAMLRGACVYDTKRPFLVDIGFEEQSSSIHFRVKDMLFPDRNTRIVINNREMKIGDIVVTASVFTGDHDAEDGIFLLSGPGVASVGEREMVDILDIAPTLLRLQGFDICGYADGKMLEDVIDPQWAERNPAKVIASCDEVEFRPERAAEICEEEITEQLKALGYM